MHPNGWQNSVKKNEANTLKMQSRAFVLLGDGLFIRSNSHLWLTYYSDHISELYTLTNKSYSTVLFCQSFDGT